MSKQNQQSQPTKAQEPGASADQPKPQPQSSATTQPAGTQPQQSPAATATAPEGGGEEQPATVSREEHDMLMLELEEAEQAGEKMKLEMQALRDELAERDEAMREAEKLARSSARGALGDMLSGAPLEALVQLREQLEKRITELQGGPRRKRVKLRVREGCVLYGGLAYFAGQEFSVDPLELSKVRKRNEVELVK